MDYLHYTVGQAHNGQVKSWIVDDESTWLANWL